jgi:hypothetical protein
MEPKLMSTSASWFDPHSAGRPGKNSHTAKQPPDKSVARLAVLESMATRYTAGSSGPVAANTDTRDEAQGLPGRIRQLIQLEGSAAAIADRCGFSAGAVRNWRDGHSDISRERCVTLARTLGISLLWLLVGEGPMRAADAVPARPAELVAAPAAEPVATEREPLSAPSPATGVDPKLLAAALRLLQSYIGLLGGSLDQATRADLLAELYGILGHGQGTEQIDRLMTFHNKLSAELRGNRGLIA